MTTTVETVPTTWSASDEQFFRLASAIFAPAFLQGAGVLLASYDPETEPAVVAGPRQSPVEQRATAPSPVAL